MQPEHERTDPSGALCDKDSLPAKHREVQKPVATVALTVRYLDLRKPQRKRYEMFDTIVPGFAIRVRPPIYALLPHTAVSGTWGIKPAHGRQ